MVVDKTWMDISNRRLPRYEEGAKKFIEFAFSGCSADKLLRCPCRILLGQEGKTKDNINSRFDMEIMGIQPKLHATPTDDGKYLFHNAPYTLFGPQVEAEAEGMSVAVEGNPILHYEGDIEDEDEQQE